MRDIAESIEPEVAIRLGCIEMRYVFNKHFITKFLPTYLYMYMGLAKKGNC